LSPAPIHAGRGCLSSPAVAQAAAEPDPAFALIERFKEASAIYGRAAAAEEQAIDRFRDRFGRSRPEALSKEVRATALPK
jgi:hypothetical protein